MPAPVVARLSSTASMRISKAMFMLTSATPGISRMVGNIAATESDRTPDLMVSR